MTKRQKEINAEIREINEMLDDTDNTEMVDYLVSCKQELMDESAYILDLKDGG